MRLGREDARKIAREFRQGRGRAWAWTTLRDELIDAEVMDQIRRSWTADSDKPATPAEIVGFRSILVEELKRKGFAL